LRIAIDEKAGWRRRKTRTTELKRKMVEDEGETIQLDVGRRLYIAAAAEVNAQCRSTWLRSG
jgi:hypothetical protein